MCVRQCHVDTNVKQFVILVIVLKIVLKDVAENVGEIGDSVNTSVYSNVMDVHNRLHLVTRKLINIWFVVTECP